MFYKVMRKLSHIEIADGARDYRLMNRAMVDSILSVSEYNRFSKESLPGSDMIPNGWNFKM